jgi:multidrug efflux pump
MTGALEAILGRPRTVLTLMLVMIIAGIISYIAIPKEANPDVDVPVYYVSISQQGISPEDAERLLVRPMETELRGLDGLKELTAIASEGHAGIVLEFEIGANKESVLADIRDKVDLAQAELPADAEEPQVFETNFALQPTIIVTLSGDVPERTLFSLARNLQDEIEAISTVREANIKGNREELLEVILDLMKLESYDITQQELLTSLTEYNQLVPAGFIDDGNSRFNIKLPGLVENAEDVFSIPIKQNEEGVVTLGDVAEIRRTFKDASSYTRVNGQPAISLEVVKRIGTNIIDNNQEVRRVVEEFSKDWPETIRVNFLIDQSSFIYEVLGSLQSSILTAITLVMIVVVGSLGLQSGLLVGLAIPTSFMVGFLILGTMGLTVNMMIMFGLVLTVGMLVDGAIVMTEYADRKISEGLPPDEAYKRAANLMFWPIVSSTATTLAAFLPLLFWPGVSGEFMSYLPIMVIIVLSASLLTALIFVPTTGIAVAYYANWTRNNARIAQTMHVALAVALVGILTGFGLLEGPMRLAGGLAGAAIAAFATWLLMGVVLRYRAHRPEKVESADAKMLSAEVELDTSRLTGPVGLYVRFLEKVTGSVMANVAVIAFAIAISISTFIAFAMYNNGVEFFIEDEPDVASLFISARGNLSASDIRDLAIEVEKEVLQVPGFDNVVMTANAPGGSRGSGGIDLAAPQDMPADVIATMQIEMADFTKRRKASEVFEEVRQRTAGIPGIKVEIRKMEGGPPTGKDVRLELKSNNYDTLVENVGKVRAFFDTQEDLRDLEDGRPLPGIEWEIKVDRQEAGRFNAGISSLGAMVQLVTNGVLIGNYRPDDSEDVVDIRVRLPEDERSLGHLDQLKLRTVNGQVPISNFVNVTPQPKVSAITRKDGLYAMDVKANLAEGAQYDGREMLADDKVRQVQAWLDTQSWPDNLQMRFRGADEEQQEAGAFLARAAMASLFLMFIILVTQYNSFYQTFLTLMTVVLAMVGVLLGMLITGQKFSIIFTGTGIVALAGIVVNNAIVLIDTYNRMRGDGVAVHEAILKTSAQRFRPIFLTTFTTILGLIPMALTISLDYFDQIISIGSITSMWWIQLSTAVISGLAFSTLLTLVLTPVMLSMPTNITNLFARRQEQPAQTAKQNRKRKAASRKNDNWHMPQAAE